jgi:glycosyltransferase involved in cell wall biosynthesis
LEELSESCSVLIFNATTPLSVGGVKRFSQELVNAIRSSGTVTYDLFGSKEGGIVSSFFKLVSRFNDILEKVDIVHFVTLSPYNIPFILLAKMNRKRIVSTYHGIYSLEVSFSNKPQIFISHWIADKIFRICSDKIVSPSEYLLNKLNIKQNTAVIPNPFKIQTSVTKKNHIIKTTQDNILLVTSSNFNIKKKSDGLHFLIEAMDDIASEYGSIRLLIFGDGIDLPRFKSENIHNKNLVFMDFRSDFAYYLENAYAYVHISGLDNQPYSIIEAMMLAKVIICNDLESLVEMIDPGNNYVVHLDSTSIAHALRSLIMEVLENHEEFERRSQENKLFAVSRYSSEVVAIQYLKLYMKILQNVGKTNVQ